mgnify:CR=1 FL=1
MKFAKLVDEGASPMLHSEAVQGFVSFDASEGARSKREFVVDGQRRVVAEFDVLKD